MTLFPALARRRQSDKRLREMVLAREAKRGLLIAFEGPDGSGKTTQRKLFKNWLKKRKMLNARYVFARELGEEECHSGRESEGTQSSGAPESAFRKSVGFRCMKFRIFSILSLSEKSAEVRARRSISRSHKADADANRRIL